MQIKLNNYLKWSRYDARLNNNIITNPAHKMCYLIQTSKKKKIYTFLDIYLSRVKNN